MNPQHMLWLAAAYYIGYSIGKKKEDVEYVPVATPAKPSPDELLTEQMIFDEQDFPESAGPDVPSGYLVMSGGPGVMAAHGRHVRGSRRGAASGRVWSDAALEAFTRRHDASDSRMASVLATGRVRGRRVSPTYRSKAAALLAYGR